MREQAERFGAELVTDDVTAVDLTGPIKVVTDGEGTELPRARRDPRDRLGLPRDRPRRREAALRPRRLLVRDLRRLLLPRPAHRRRRRRRLRDRGGDLPHPLRRDGHPRPPSRQPARQQDHAGARVRQREDPVRLEQRGRRDPRRRQGHRRRAARHRSPARPATLDVTGLFVAIGHDPRTRAVRGPGRASTTRATSRSRAARPAPTSPACSPAATSSTTPTARPSPRPAPGCAAALDAEQLPDLARGRRVHRTTRCRSSA